MILPNRVLEKEQNCYRLKKSHSLQYVGTQRRASWSKEKKCCPFPTILRVKKSRHSETIAAKKKVYLNTSISDDWDLGSPRHSETISAKKRYTLIPLFPTILRVKEPPCFRNHFSQKKVYLDTSISDDFQGQGAPPSFRKQNSQKKVYLNTSISDDFKGWGAPPSFRKQNSQKKVYLNTSISDDWGLRSPPIIQKKFQPKNGIP